MMSEGIVFLLILVSASGGAWLATILIAEVKRRRRKRAIEREFARYFPPIARRRSKAKSETKIATRPVRVAVEKCERETVPVKNSARAFFPPRAGTDPI